MAVTKQQIKAHLEVIKAVAETIRDLGSVPSGHLYAMVMQHFSLEEYNSIITVLKRAGVVEERHHELFWIGQDPRDGSGVHDDNPQTEPDPRDGPRFIPNQPGFSHL